MTGPNIPRGAVQNTHHPRNGPPLTIDQIAALRCRPLGQRCSAATLPKPGEAIGYRHDEGGPVHRAVVVDAGSLTDPGPHPDLNVWRVVTDDRRQAVLDAFGRYVYELVDDPWPEMTIRIGPAAPDPEQPKAWRMTVACREARMAGAGGWLPVDQITPMPVPPVEPPQGAPGRKG